MDANFERSPDTDRIVKVLRGVNQEISYSDIAKQAQLSVLRTKQVLGSARRILRNSEKLMFGTVIGWGIKRLSDDDKVRKSGDNRKRLARTAGRALKELDTIQAFDRLPATDQLVVTTNRTIFTLSRQQLLGASPIARPATPNAAEPNTRKLVRIGRT
jgi:hypothetical protein